MNRRIRLASMFVFLLAVTPLFASDPPWAWWRAPWLRSPANMNGCPPLGGCVDDYCKKPMPHLVDVPRCGGPDDYCKKPMPHLVDVPRCGGPDDYCRKPMPTLLCPIVPHR